MSRKAKMPDSLSMAKVGKAQAYMTLNDMLPRIRIAGFSVNG
jgi:hypothetical protein